MSSPSPEPPPTPPEEHVYQPAGSLSDHNTNTTTSTIPAGGGGECHQRHSPCPSAKVQVQTSDQQVHSCPCLEQREKAVEMLNSDSSVGHCLTSQHHNVINLIAHMPPGGGGGHVHPNSQVHVHVHASPKSLHHNHHNHHNTTTKDCQSTTAPSCTCHHHHRRQDSNSGGGNIANTNNSSRAGDLSILHEPTGGVRKLDADDRIEVSPLPPALPPRPPPRPRFDHHGALQGTGLVGARLRSIDASNSSRGIRKYVFWCCVCGGLSAILGLLFMIVYFIVRTYTSTLAYFETIPTIVPAIMLILTGICVISLARRKNRYSYLIKVCGLCCLVCAVTCVLVTITTTVIHMSRLQTLRECVYTSKTRTCTCYSVLLEAHASTDEGMRFVFDSTPDCEVIHGILYSCLRAMFGLSVSGILICIFSCMLVYQLLSHERKKMYWEQLELRCRSFYSQHTAGAQLGSVSTPGSMRSPPMMQAPHATATYCSCCEECVYPTVPPIAVQPQVQVYPWEPHPNAERFWTPGRVGNFYSPNPGEEIAGNTEGRDRANSGWSWRRLAWNRSNTNSNNIDNNRDNSVTYHGIIPTSASSGADSQYGFSAAPRAHSTSTTAGAISTSSASAGGGAYSLLDQRSQPPPPIPGTVGGGAQPPGVYVWGPPPPYSDPNSPARRSVGRYNGAGAGMHVHHHHGYPQLQQQQVMVGGHMVGHHAHHGPTPQQHQLTHVHHPLNLLHNHETHCQLNEDLSRLTAQDNQQQARRLLLRGNKDNYENATEHDMGPVHDNNESTTTDTSGYSVGVQQGGNTVPTRKMKKRSGGGGDGGHGMCQQQMQQGASIKSQGQSHHRTSVKTIFKPQQPNEPELKSPETPEYHEPDEVKTSSGSSDTSVTSSTSSHVSAGSDRDQCRYLPRLQGVENAAFQKQESVGGGSQKTTIVGGQEPSESEVYFADVSSCCNISVRNDSVLYDEALLETQKPRLTSLQKAVAEAKNSQLLQTFQENICNSTVTEDEEYLAHRLGQRQLSTRSRLPFPLPLTSDVDMPDSAPPPSTNLQPPIIIKDQSQHSLCSSASAQTPMTESTDCDNSPSTPTTTAEFTRRGDFLAPDAQYEVIQEKLESGQGPNLTSTISELNNFGQNGGYFGQQKMSPPKSLNFNQTPSRRIGTNISSLIHNLSGSSSGLLYGDDHSGGEDDLNLHEEKKKMKEVHSQNSDCTMDSGWQSGSDKADRKGERCNENNSVN